MNRRNLIVLLLASIVLLGVVPVLLWRLGSSLDPFTPSPDKAYAGPDFQQWAGRDELGRSALARVIFAFGLSLAAARLALLIALALSVSLGGVAGWYHNQWPDRLISWVIALLHTVPFFLL